MPNGKKKYVRISVKKFEGQTQAFKMARDPKQACLCFLMNPKMGSMKKITHFFKQISKNNNQSSVFPSFLYASSFLMLIILLMKKKEKMFMTKKIYMDIYVFFFEDCLKDGFISFSAMFFYRDKRSSTVNV
jgi:hypothetical protein